MTDVLMNKVPTAPRKAEVARCQALADLGIIPQGAVYAAAALLRAAATVQELCGPGHSALDVVAVIATARYVKNWITDWLGRSHMG